MRLRVLHCLETIGSGGVERRRLSLAKYLDAERFEQQVVCSYVVGGFDERFKRYGVQVTAIRGLYHLLNLGYYLRLLRVVRKYRPHIIHGAVFEGVISAIVAGLVFRIPIVIIEETSDPQGRSARGTWLLRQLSRFATFVVGISPSVVTYLRDSARIAGNKIRLINNGVEPPENIDAERISVLKASLGITQKDFVIGSVGRLNDFHKRFSDLIKTLPLLGERIPGIKLLIVGDGNDRAALLTLSRELGVEKRVIFAGFQTDLWSYYGCMDVFALASHTEGFGLVVVEAMFSKLAVVATAVGGIPDVVVAGKTGMLVARHSPAELSEAIAILFDHPERRKQMGEAGYERAGGHFSATTYARNVESLYEEAKEKMRLK